MVVDGTSSPFFRPSEKPDFTRTPGGTRLKRKKAAGEEEHKSTLVGCAANLINAIVGAGIVGLPYAVKKAGFVAGIVLVLLCAVLTEKSLRLLVETAKHAHVPSYETVSEAAFGRFGFMFVAINMFIMAYGAMLSYLMIVKDTWSGVFGIDEDDYPAKRALLFIISISIIVPVSSQRDMADLAKTSRLNVIFDLLMVLLVLYLAPIQESWKTFEWKKSIIHYDTIFVGLGVLSFAYVCQHSAFIIAGSLERPTRNRWSTVTKMALIFACTLALSCGVGGYVAYQGDTDGNILNNLDESVLAKVARALLGTTMLFVYPMECFVARHVLVVLFFQGRSAHEGDDASVLTRRDRRITLTIFLYLISVIPAALSENLGVVLAASGAVGGSCLSYIGPGAVYLGIHGARFLELSRAFFGHPDQKEGQTSVDEELAPLYSEPVTADLPSLSNNSWLLFHLKNILYYLLLMPVWSFIASVGKSNLTDHVCELAMKSPHPIRIGNVRFARAKLTGGGTRVVMLEHQHSDGEGRQPTAPTDTMLIRSDSLPKGYGTARGPGGEIVALPPMRIPIDQSKLLPPTAQSSSKGGYQSINDQIGAMAKRKQQEEELALEDDPQQDPPGVIDFMIAVFFIVFGVLAMVAGLWSIFV